MVLQTQLTDELKKVPEFQTVPPEQIEWLASKGKLMTYHDGDKIFKPGDLWAEMSILLEGEFNIYREQTGNLQFLYNIEKYEITGNLPYSRMKTTSAYGIAIGEVITFTLHRDHFPEMVRQCYELTEVLVHIMTDRVREFTQMQQQNDKLAALGKLSAGLAHELNNPSAAVTRSAQELKRHLANLPEKFKRVINIKATEAQVDFVNHLLFGKIEESKGKKLSLMERTNLEDSLTAWLENDNIENAYDIAETFAEYCFHETDLQALKGVLRAEDVSPIVNWLNQVLTTERLVNEIAEASTRINNLVTSIKSYTHMDQAPEKQKADVHEGLRTTLTMLGHKFKKNNVKLIENFDPNLPQASIYVSAMNQVWMNLLDNALDALEGTANATLEIKTEKDREFILVYITDNGPGIPKEIQDKIFDPFFTTKPIGKGTGLGLEIVRQIIHQHNGKVDLRSEPGRTEFRVCFPY
jgi:signal transduction histidine kinase